MHQAHDAQTMQLHCSRIPKLRDRRGGTGLHQLCSNRRQFRPEFSCCPRGWKDLLHLCCSDFEARSVWARTWSSSETWRLSHMKIAFQAAFSWGDKTSHHKWWLCILLHQPLPAWAAWSAWFSAFQTFSWLVATSKCSRWTMQSSLRRGCQLQRQRPSTIPLQQT